MQTVSPVWSPRDEAAFALMLSGFEVVADPPCCLACSVRALMAKGVSSGGFAVFAEAEDQTCVVVGSLDGRPASARANRALQGTFGVLELCSD